MAYKTILVHLDQIARARTRIQVAASLAKKEDACLVGAAMIGISTLTFLQAGIDERDPAVAGHLNFLRDRASNFVNDFEEEVKKTGLVSYEGRVVDGEAEYGISLQARYADLIVVGKTNLQEDSPIVQPDFPEFIVMNSGRPVLIIPHTYEKPSVGHRVLIPWNASKEVTRAITDAMPILRHADVVQLVMYNIESEPDMRAEGVGSDVALYLARHGVNVEVLPPKQERNVGKALLETAEENGTDLLVMGGYGHTRFRQFLLGGVTRTILNEADLPVFMSH